MHFMEVFILRSLVAREPSKLRARPGGKHRGANDADAENQGWGISAMGQEGRARRCRAPTNNREKKAASSCRTPKGHGWLVLAERRGEIGQCEKGGVNLFYQFSIGFGLIADALPFGIVAEGFPVGGGGIAAGMSEDVEERFAFEGFVERRPVRHVSDSMFLEEAHGMFPKTAQQVVQLALEGVVDAEFVDCC